MSHNPTPEKRKIDDASPEDLRREMENYVNHMMGHDPKAVEFAVIVTGHGNEDGGTHVCSLIGGPSYTLAKVVVALMGELIEQKPELTMFFLASVMQRTDIDTQVKYLLNRIKNNMPPNGSVH